MWALSREYEDDEKHEMKIVAMFLEKPTFKELLTFIPKSPTVVEKLLTSEREILCGMHEIWSLKELEEIKL